MTRVAAVVAALALLVTAACSGGDDTAAPATNGSPGAATTTTAPPVFTAAVAGERVVDPIYRQGLARTKAGWVFSFNDGLFLTDTAFKKTKDLTPAIPAVWKARGYDHIGDVDVVGDTLYAPLEQPNYDLGHQVMLVYDATTLAFRRGVEVPQHQNSFVTVDDGIAYTMDGFGGRALLRYDVRTWAQLSSLRMSKRIARVQGADIRDGAAWLSTDDEVDGVYRVDLATGQVQALGSIGHVDGEGEGIDATPDADGDLHVLSLDAKVIPVRLIALKLTERPG
jgi:hypothetical protein